MKLKLQQVGFTLVEILLVLVVAGVLATLGATLLQQRAQTAKVEQTAQQIQLLLQAGSAYYIDQGAWPDSSQSLTNFTPYLPFSINQNPFGPNAYEFHPSANGVKFQVIAHNIPERINKQLAKQVAALLPSAVLQNCGATSCDIAAETVVPPPSQAQSRYIIASIQSLQANLQGKSITAPLQMGFNCPSGMIPKIEPVLSSIQVEHTGWEFRVACGNIAHFPIYYINFSPANCSQSQSPNQYLCSFTLTAVYVPGVNMFGLCYVAGVGGLGNVTVTGIGYCCKPGFSNTICAAPN